MHPRKSDLEETAHQCHPGCEHDHEHHHHDHHHAQGHQPSPDDLFHAPGESPAVYSTTRPVSCPRGVAGPDFTAAMTRCVEKVRDWAADHRHLVGHIKVFVENGKMENLWLASTGKGINLKTSEGWDAGISETFQLHFTAIVFGTDPDHLKTIALTHIDRELKHVSTGETMS
ncbi:MAG: hypothetical protein H6Q00_148 [Holophagaceae bacterium]|nr:hypothetical protein [Holophagaceae bacterium]